MRKNPGRKEARKEEHTLLRKKGDRNRKSGHKLRTHDGMVASGKFKRTPQGMVEV